MLAYYEAVINLKKNFVRSIDPYCYKKREIYKIWAHWLIRILSKNDVNYHLLSKIDDKIDFDIMKHITGNNIPADIGRKVYFDLVKSMNKLYHLYGESHQHSVTETGSIQFIQNQIQLSYDSKTDTYHLEIDKLMPIKINADIYDKLKIQYTGKSELFIFYLYELLFNYYILDGKSLQWSVPQDVFEYLGNHGLNGELFASPLNNKHQKYYSLFYVDTFFGSSGNFYNITNLQSGFYEINPPFIEEIFLTSANTINQILLNSISSSIGFVYILPQWENLGGYNLLLNSQFYISQLILGKNRHNYYQYNNKKYIIASFNTIILLLGTKHFRNSHDCSAILNNISLRFTNNKKLY